MSEGEVVARTPAVRTRETLVGDLRRLGLAGGDVVLVHCALSAIGWVAGGAPAVILALRDVVGETGTLVMPAMSGQLTDPAFWRDPAVPEAWHEQIRAGLPAFDARTTPTRGMGVVAEQFRTWPGACRSRHPTLSFAAIGPEARRITRRHPLRDPFGEGSPLGVLYDLGASILLLGVGFDRCTALHLAECRAWPRRPPEDQGAPVMVKGERRWVRYASPPADASPFPAVGAHLTALGLVLGGVVGSAESRLLAMRPALDGALAWWRTSPQ